MIILFQFAVSCICTHIYKEAKQKTHFSFLSFLFSWQFSFPFSLRFLFFGFRLLNVISVFRLWAEVFHVAASGAGQVKWQQVSEDLVPVNITCIQDSPECVFHITAYNSQVDKILDVRLVQPGKKRRNNFLNHQVTSIINHLLSLEHFVGTRIGQASECFVYWKDPMTNDTWGLNFTSPIDAKQFRECCVSIKKQYFLSFSLCLSCTNTRVHQHNPARQN